MNGAPRDYPTIEQLKMRQEVLDYDGEGGNRRLTDWEIDFVQGLLGRFAHQPDETPPMLTGRQAKKLEEIWQEIFG